MDPRAVGVSLNKTRLGATSQSVLKRFEDSDGKEAEFLIA